MKTISNKNFPAALIGQIVQVKIPDFDRCKIDSRTLLAVVVEIINEEFYGLGSKAGILNQLFTRNQFTLCEEKFISISDVPNTTTSIRQAVAQLSLSGGQGFLRLKLSDFEQTSSSGRRSLRVSLTSDIHFISYKDLQKLVKIKTKQKMVKT
ncbi:hypothetical protein QTP88_028690 [Uroleucon formosanum]